MSREYKFRGIDSDTGYWVYGYLVRYMTGYYEICYQNEITPLNTLIKRRVIPETVGQFSGWKDRECKELYEGDIVQRWAHDDNTHKHEKATVFHDGGRTLDIKEIKFMSGSFVIWSDLIKEYRCFIHLARPGESLELLGNIYDNPNILKKNTTD